MTEFIRTPDQNFVGLAGFPYRPRYRYESPPSDTIDMQQ